MSSFKSLRMTNLTSKTMNIGRPKVYEDAELEALLDEDSPNAKRTYIRSDSTNNFISFEIIGNDSKAKELGSI